MLTTLKNHPQWLINPNIYVTFFLCVTRGSGYFVTVTNCPGPNVTFCSICTISGYAEDRLHLENTKKNEIFFGILLDLHYLCNMTTKNLYTTIGLLTCKTLVFIQNYPPQFCNRLKTRQTPLVLANPSLLLSAPAFSGRDFCVNHLIAESKNFLTPLLIWPNYQNQSI